MALIRGPIASQSHLHLHPLIPALRIFQGLHVHLPLCYHTFWMKKKSSFPLISLSRIYLFLERSCPSLKNQLKYYLLLGILKALWPNLPHRHHPTNIWVSTHQKTENWELGTHFTCLLHSPNEAGILIILFAYFSLKKHRVWLIMVVWKDTLLGISWLLIHYQPDVNIASNN